MTRSWIKLWVRWYESTSHALLSPQALHTGPHLLVLASRHGIRGDAAHLVRPTGDALTIQDLARITRWPPKVMGNIIRDIMGCGTMERDGSSYFFPKFMRWQESTSASRVRKHRGADDDDAPKGVTVTLDVTPDVTLLKRPRNDRGEKREDRGEKTDLKPPNPPRGRGRPKPAGRESDPELVDAANAVIDRINEHRASIVVRYRLQSVPKFTHAKTHRTEILRVLGEGEPIENLMAVVDAAACEVMANAGEGLQWLSPSTPFRAANWSRYLAKVGAPPPRSHGPSAPRSGRYEITGNEDYGDVDGAEVKL